MKKSLLLWSGALLLTLLLALYQRFTGPTYPISGTISFEGEQIAYTFERTHAGPSGHTVAFPAPSEGGEAAVEWKRFSTDDPWTRVPMVRQGELVKAELPYQPPAGKLEYRVQLVRGSAAVTIPAEAPVVIRFRGEVPAAVLVPHVLAMFGAMLFSTRTGLEALTRGPRLSLFLGMTVGLLFVGGLILGPVVQKFAFDAYWTGWPLGHDLTDNKTLVAFLAWLAAGGMILRDSARRGWAVGAAILLLVVYLIPHSLLGSELDYREADARKNPAPASLPAPAVEPQGRPQLP